MDSKCPACGCDWPLKDGGYGCESCTREYGRIEIARLRAELAEAAEDLRVMTGARDTAIDPMWAVCEAKARREALEDFRQWFLGGPVSASPSDWWVLKPIHDELQRRLAQPLDNPPDA